MKPVAKRKRDLAAPLSRRAKFLRLCPDGFNDPKYLEWKRRYKSNAHERWVEELGLDSYRELLPADTWKWPSVPSRSRAGRICCSPWKKWRSATRSVDTGACVVAV